MNPPCRRCIHLSRCTHCLADPDFEFRTEAQEVIAAVLREHQNCSPGCTPELVADQIDKALGGLRKITSHGYLTPSGFLAFAYAGITHDLELGPGPKAYVQYITGWTEVTG